MMYCTSIIMYCDIRTILHMHIQYYVCTYQIVRHSMSASVSVSIRASVRILSMISIFGAFKVSAFRV